MKKILVVGASRVGLEAARRLYNSVLIEADPAIYTILKRQHPDRDIYGGDARQPETLISAGIENAEALVLVTNKDYVNLKVALAAREFTPYLPYAPSYFAKVESQEGRAANRKRQLLQRMIRALPPGADLTPLREVPPGSFAYGASREVLHREGVQDE